MHSISHLSAVKRRRRVDKKACRTSLRHFTQLELDRRCRRSAQRSCASAHSLQPVSQLLQQYRHPARNIDSTQLKATVPGKILPFDPTIKLSAGMNDNLRKRVLPYHRFISSFSSQWPTVKPFLQAR
jgi:hypothetical protein